MNHPFRLDGQNALITGSTRGLGLAIAHAFGSSGASVGLNGRDPETVQAACSELSEEGIAASAFPFDVTDTATALAAIDEFMARHGSLDVFVHNAGHGMRIPLLEHSFHDWQRTLDVHLSAGFTMAQSAARHMRTTNRPGRIIFVSSILGSIGRSTVPAYCAAKGGMNALVRSMSAELGPHGITVNAIAPGYIVTELTRPLHTDTTFSETVCQQTPVGRWGKPEEIGWAALYLASEAGAYVNGHILTVDGGMTTTV